MLTRSNPEQECFDSDKKIRVLTRQMCAVYWFGKQRTAQAFKPFTAISLYPTYRKRVHRQRNTASIDVARQNPPKSFAARNDLMLCTAT